MSEELTGVQIANQIGIPLDEGVVVILLPEVIEKSETREIPYLDSKDNRMLAVVADCGPWGPRMIDLMGLDGKPVKWWKVKEAAAQEGLNLAPVRWEGPIGEIPQRYLDGEGVVALRLYQHGPVFFPKEKPRDLEKEKEEQMIADKEAELNG